MQARIDGSQGKPTRTGLDWSHRYRRTIEALGSLKVNRPTSTASFAHSTRMA